MKDYLFQPSRKGMRSRLWSWRVQLKDWPRVRTIPLHVTDKRVAGQKREAMLREFELEAAGVPGHGSARIAAARPIAEHLAAFLEDVKARGCREGTLEKYSGVIPKLCERCGWKSLKDVTAESFIRWRASSVKAAKSLNDDLATMCAFLNWLERSRLVIANPLKCVGRVSGAGGREYRRALSVSEARALCAVAPSARACVYKLVLYTGLRRFELNRIRWRDFDFTVHPARLVLAASDSKGGKRPAIFELRPEVSVPLQSMYLAARESGRPFGQLDDFAFRWHVPRVRTLKRDLAAAKIPFLDELGRRVDLHSLRKTFITWFSAAGVAPRVVMALARHSDLRLTMGVYTDASQLELGAALARLPVIANGSDDAHGHSHEMVAEGLGGSDGVAGGRLIDSGEPLGSVAVMPEPAQPVAMRQRLKMGLFVKEWGHGALEAPPCPL